MVILNSARLVQSALLAYRDNRLGILRGRDAPHAVQRDWSVCFVTASLPRLTLASIRQRGHDRLNWLALMRLNYFSVADLKTVELLSLMQIEYDKCCVSNPCARRRMLKKLIVQILLGA